MPKRKPAPVAPPTGRRCVVLKSELAVEGFARPLRIGAVVEAKAERFAALSADHVRDATADDVAVAGSHFVRLDVEPPPAEVVSPPVVDEA